MRVRTTTNPFELFLNSFGLLRVFFFLSLVGNKLAVATAFFFLARDGGGSNVERVSSSVNLTTLAPGVKTCIERATETKEEEEERRRKKKEEGRDLASFFSSWNCPTQCLLTLSLSLYVFKKTRSF